MLRVRLKADGRLVEILPDGSELTVTTRDNWAIEPGPFGFTVVDIDPKNGGDETWAALIAKHGEIVTREVRTPSGGRHLWFRGTISDINKKLGPGIDTRCFGGYVLLLPSSVMGRPYEWFNTAVPIAPLPECVGEILEAQADESAARRADGDEYAIDAGATEAFAAWRAAGGKDGS